MFRFTDPTRRPRWLQFSLRTLLLLILVAALGVAWWVDRGRLTAEIDALRFPPLDLSFDPELFRD